MKYYTEKKNEYHPSLEVLSKPPLGSRLYNKIIIYKETSQTILHYILLLKFKEKRPTREMFILVFYD